MAGYDRWRVRRHGEGGYIVLTCGGRGCKEDSVNGEEEETSSERTRGQHGEVEELEERDRRGIIPAGGVLSSKESSLVGRVVGGVVENAQGKRSGG